MKFYQCLQGEGVSDTDIHTQIAQEIKSHFNRKPRPSVSSAGIRLVAVSYHWIHVPHEKFKLMHGSKKSLFLR